jgi:membrane associated rhomboid family serine protease
MILPLGDAPNPRGTPFATYLLILINVAAYLLFTLPLSVEPPDPNDPTLAEYVRVIRDALPPGPALEQALRELSAYDLFVFRHGFRPASPSVLAMFAAMFLHAGLLHLVGNMLFLWIYGDNVEHRLGPPGFVLWYLVSGVAATLFQTGFSLGSPIPMIGASGAVSGVLGFYFIWFPHNHVRLLVAFFPFYMNVVHVGARLVLGFYLVADNLLPFLFTWGRQGGGVAHGAHIGGFLLGLAVAWVLDRREMNGRPREYHRLRRGELAADTPAAALAAALAQGDHGRAAEIYFGLGAAETRGVLGAEDALRLGDWLARNGHGKAALVLYERQLRDDPRGPGAAEAHLGAGLVQLRDLHRPAVAYQHFLDALDLDPAPATAQKARAGLAEIAALQKLQLRRWPGR